MQPAHARQHGRLRGRRRRRRAQGLPQRVRCIWMRHQSVTQCHALSERQRIRIDVGVRQKCFDTGGLRKLKRFELEHPLTIRILVLYAETRQHLQERVACGIGILFFQTPDCRKRGERRLHAQCALPEKFLAIGNRLVRTAEQRRAHHFDLHPGLGAGTEPCLVLRDPQGGGGRDLRRRGGRHPRPSKSTTELQPNFAHGMFHRPGQRRPDLPGRTRPMGRGNGFGIEALRDRWYGTRTRPCVLRIGIGCAEGILWTRARTRCALSPVRRCRWRARGQQ